MNFLRDLKEYDKDNIPVSFKKKFLGCVIVLSTPKILHTIACLNMLRVVMFKDCKQ